MSIFLNLLKSFLPTQIDWENEANAASIDLLFYPPDQRKRILAQHGQSDDILLVDKVVVFCNQVNDKVLARAKMDEDQLKGMGRFLDIISTRVKQGDTEYGKMPFPLSKKLDLRQYEFANKVMIFGNDKKLLFETSFSDVFGNQI